MQIKDYDTYCDSSILVIRSTHAGHAAEYVPGRWGIIVVNREGGGQDFYALREATYVGKTKLKNQLRLLCRRELGTHTGKEGSLQIQRKAAGFR